MPQRNWALESQEFGAERSREGNQYRIQQGETVRQGLSSLVPGFQQAQKNQQEFQIREMQAGQELAMDEVQRQGAIESLAFARDLHQTKMSRAAAEAALSTAALQIAQNEAAMKKLDAEGYSKIPRLTEEQVEDMIAGGWIMQMDGTHRGYGRVVEAPKERVEAAKKSKQEREIRRATLKGAAERLSYGDMSAEEFEGMVNNKPGARLPARPRDPPLGELGMLGADDGGVNLRGTTAAASPSAKEDAALATSILTDMDQRLLNIIPVDGMFLGAEFTGRKLQLLALPKPVQQKVVAALMPEIEATVREAIAANVGNKNKDAVVRHAVELFLKSLDASDVTAILNRK